MIGRAGPCTLGAGCDEAGVCYATWHGKPEECPLGIPEAEEVRRSPRDRLWLLGFLVGPLFAWLCWCVSRRRWAQGSLALLVNIAFWVGGGFVLGEMGAMLRAAGS